MIWVLVTRGRQFGLEVTLYDNPIAAREAARAIVRKALDHYDLDRPDDLRVDENPWGPNATAPYWARIVDVLEVTVYRKEIKHGT